MAQTKVEKLSDEKLKEMGVFNWPIWEKEASTFDWSYGSTEKCYILKGKVEVTEKSGEKVEFGAGDFVTFPQGLECTWHIIEDVKKHYNFG